MKTKHGFVLLALSLCSVAGIVLLSMDVNASARPSSAIAAPSHLDTSVLNVLRPETWISPVNVTHSSSYDNGPGASGIAASQLDNSVSILWGRANGSGCTGSGEVMETSNSPLNSNFSEQRLTEACVAANGNTRVKHDALGVRHVVYWQADRDSPVCDYYARIEANGAVSVQHELIPGTCNLSRKNTALAVSPDGTVHAFFGNNNLGEMYYYQRNPLGVWTVVGEPVTTSGAGDLTAAVTSNGVAMAAWKGNSPGGYSDIFAATRNSNGTWTPEDISYACCEPSCPTNSRAYLPALAADGAGGIRASWSDEHCDPRTDPNSQDIYYREWTPGVGWAGHPLVRVVNNVGYSYQNAIAVDITGQAKIDWTDTIGATGNFQLFFSSGIGTVFDAPTIPFQGWGNYQKDVGIDTGPGFAHVAFGSDRDDSNKDNYYSYSVTGPPPPTSTPTATFTPTNTPTPCALGHFGDVQPTDYFYSAVLDLVTRGIMSGYNNCTFLPYNNITRGQTAKIVVLGANVAIFTPPSPTFRDVPTSNTFYTYIESAYHGGVISGYSCGTGCLEYHPGDPVTRGQFTKMMVNAFHFTIFTPPSPTFRDVPATNTFYQYIETLNHLGIISGYSCGTGCLEFRPGNSITRGQAAKVLFNARGIQFATATPTIFFITATVTNTTVTDTPTSTPVVITNTPVNTTTPTVTTTPPTG